MMLVLLCLSMGSVLQAQSGLGIRAGLHLATLASDQDNFDSKNILGFDAALLYNLELGGGWHIQPEAHFIQKGSTLKNSNDDLDLKLNYIELAVPIQMDLLADDPATSLAPFIGPSVGYLVSGKLGDIDVKDLDYEDLDFGLQMGVNLTLASKIFIDVRYLLGLADISSDNGSTTVKTRNRGFNIGAGLLF